MCMFSAFILCAATFCVRHVELIAATKKDNICGFNCVHSIYLFWCAISYERNAQNTQMRKEKSNHSKQSTDLKSTTLKTNVFEYYYYFFRFHFILILFDAHGDWLTNIIICEPQPFISNKIAKETIQLNKIPESAVARICFFFIFNSHTNNADLAIRLLVIFLFSLYFKLIELNMHNELVVLLNKYKHKHTMRNNGVMRWTRFFPHWKSMQEIKWTKIHWHWSYFVCLVLGAVQFLNWLINRFNEEFIAKITYFVHYKNLNNKIFDLF